MASIEISPGLWLCADAENKKIRISLNDGGDDLACRRETANKLHNFIANREVQLFKGRLQFYKGNDEVCVFLNKQPVGKLSPHNFSTLLNSV